MRAHYFLQRGLQHTASTSQSAVLNADNKAAWFLMAQEEVDITTWATVAANANKILNYVGHYNYEETIGATNIFKITDQSSSSHSLHF